MRKVTERFLSWGVRGCPRASCPIRRDLGFLVMKRVYRHVLTLEGESRLPGWFAGDPVGNSGLATS
jgi:hypothetical protein